MQPFTGSDPWIRPGERLPYGFAALEALVDDYGARLDWGWGLELVGDEHRRAVGQDAREPVDVRVQDADAPVRVRGA